MCNSNIIPNYNTAPIIQIAAKVNGGMVSYANLPYMEKPAASMDAAFLPDLDSIASQCALGGNIALTGGAFAN